MSIYVNLMNKEALVETSRRSSPPLNLHKLTCGFVVFEAWQEPLGFNWPFVEHLTRKHKKHEETAWIPLLCSNIWFPSTISTQSIRSVPVQTHYASAVPPVSKNEFSKAKIVLEKDRNRSSHNIFASHVHAGTWFTMLNCPRSEEVQCGGWRRNT